MKEGGAVKYSPNTNQPPRYSKCHSNNLCNVKLALYWACELFEDHCPPTLLCHSLLKQALYFSSNKRVMSEAEMRPCEGTGTEEETWGNGGAHYALQKRKHRHTGSYLHLGSYYSIWYFSRWVRQLIITWLAFFSNRRAVKLALGGGCPRALDQLSPYKQDHRSYPYENSLYFIPIFSLF